MYSLHFPCFASFLAPEIPIIYWSIGYFPCGWFVFQQNHSALHVDIGLKKKDERRALESNQGQASLAYDPIHRLMLPFASGCPCQPAIVGLKQHVGIRTTVSLFVHSAFLNYSCLILMRRTTPKEGVFAEQVIHR